MKVIWEVEDGYVGKSRPQTTEIPDEDFEPYKEDGKIDEEVKQQIIEDYVQDDFNQIISWAIVRIEE